MDEASNRSKKQKYNGVDPKAASSTNIYYDRESRMATTGRLREALALHESLKHEKQNRAGSLMCVVLQHACVLE